jgi:signal transduction histidine kinase/CheY-like chemotaxis protein
MQTWDVESTPTRFRDRGSLLAAELIRAQYANMPGAFIGSAVTASFMAAVLYDKLTAGAVLTWLVAAYVNCAMRLALWRRFHLAAPEVEAMPRWGRYAVVSAVIAGLIWGASGIVLNIPGNFSYQIVVLLVTTGLAFTSTYLSSAYMPAYRAFVYPTFALAAVPFLLGGDFWHVLIGMATLAALPLVVRYADRLCRALRTSIEVRLRNAELVEELRAQKKAADEANVAKSRFLAVASHDLRQPLHSLELFVQALEDTPLPVHAQQLVGNVRRSVDSMEELFDGLLDISRLDAGVVRAREEVIPLADLFERLSFEYAAIAQRKGLGLRVMKTSACVRSDPTLLARILRNLVANAVRYTEHGRVTIGCRRHGEQVSIEVWDTGPGVPAEKCAEIFQEFTQLGNPERDRRKGLGLGLAIVERLAKLLGHGVLLRSRVGKGSVFAVTVARGHLDEQALLESSAPPVAGHFDLRGRLVLIVHGRFAVRQELAELLGAWSCEVVAASSLTEMLGLLGGLPRSPDLIMAEHDDDGDSGAAVVDLLRNEFNFEVPALLVGTADQAGAPVDVRGALPILYRPCNAGRLRTLISNLLHPPQVEPAQARRAS